MTRSLALSFHRRGVAANVRECRHDKLPIKLRDLFCRLFWDIIDAIEDQISLEQGSTASITDAPNGAKARPPQRPQPL